MYLIYLRFTFSSGGGVCLCLGHTFCSPDLSITFSRLRYFWTHTFPCTENYDWRSTDSPTFPSSLVKALLMGTRCGYLQVPPWSYLRQTNSLTAPLWSISWRINKTTCLICQLFHTSTHIHTNTHTRTAGCCLVSLSPPLPVILYQLKSQSREKVIREIACEYATVKKSKYRSYEWLKIISIQIPFFPHTFSCICISDLLFALLLFAFSFLPFWLLKRHGTVQNCFDFYDFMYMAGLTPVWLTCLASEIWAEV